ncbi:MAG: hypothetical protein GF408_06845 [Candidatus Omnitrophica bacterium]|nr:hypothetical protein [Candidatus Omnitrophota bacterium]
MQRNVLITLLEQRKETAEKVQKILTGWGCVIRTRFGLHQGVLDDCSNSGLIILELVGEDKDHEELERKLNLLSGVNARLVKMNI